MPTSEIVPLFEKRVTESAKRAGQEKAGGKQERADFFRKTSEKVQESGGPFVCLCYRLLTA
ncbi:hypothetical protein B4098_1474 [Heyndrickxia coagulans]|uniref:Uncharacterized protein n=1 Tax=Heyndrickxia coagulans TaxID=1398 RepID=A0A150KCJ4_HEYCO|nr:hypothetical protein B4098_1474 [Heyndrickxia coagulans]